MTRFQGKVLLATGGGSGIGAATAERFVQDGGQVAVVDRNIEAAEEVAGRIDGLAIACDVSVEDEVQTAVERTVQEFGRIDCLLNNAGYSDLGQLEQWSYERWTSLMGVHVGGTFLFTKHSLRHLRSATGSIVNMASISALVGQEGNVPYGTAKGAIVGFTRQLAPEIAPEVRVNAVAPGRVLTGLTEPLLKERGGGDLSRGMALSGQLNPSKRIGLPEEIAGTVCHLFSEDSGFMTGSLLVIDGGETVTSYRNAT